MSTHLLARLNADRPVARPSASAFEDVNADELWAEHGWTLSFRHVSLIILVALAVSLLGTLLRWTGLSVV